MVNFIEDVMSKEKPGVSNQWKHTMTKDDLNMAIRSGGSKYNSAPFFRVDSEFDKDFKM